MHLVSRKYLNTDFIYWLRAFPHEVLLFHLTSLRLCPSYFAVRTKALFSYLGSGGFCDFGMVTLKLEAISSIFSFTLWWDGQCGLLVGSEGSFQRGPLGSSCKPTTVTRTLLLQNPLSKYLERAQSGLRWKPLTGFELLLTGVFCFQSCGLNLIVTLRVLRWNWSLKWKLRSFFLFSS